MPDQPATQRDIEVLRQDLGAREARIEAKLDAFAARLEGKLDALEARIRDQIRSAIQDFETNLLKAIYGYTETMTLRQDGVTKRVGEFEERLMVVERRVLELERRLNLPPGEAA